MLASGGGIFAVRKITENAYGRLVISYLSENFGMENPNDFRSEIIEKYFLEKQLWTVPIIKPLLIVLAVMCVVTVILTMISLKKFKRNIANDLNTGRTRQ